MLPSGGIQGSPGPHPARLFGGEGDQMPGL